MSLKAKLTSAVNNAFKAAGDLVETGTFSTKAVSGYDFSSGVTTSTSSSHTAKVIIYTKDKPANKPLSLKAVTKSGVNLSTYDTLTVSNVAYNITDTVDDGFAINLTVVRET